MKKTSVSYLFKNNQGFSLMEMLIYVGILGIVASVATGIFLSVTKVQTEQSAQVEISGQLNFAMQTIQRLIRNSSLVDINPGTPTTSLTLRMKDSAVDPTTIYLENGRIYVKEGANGTPQSITSDRVVVDSLEFKKLTQYPGKDIVQIDLAMSATNKVEGNTIRRSLRSAVSRVSAATFDSDLIPGADNTYSVGTSNRWKNASFSGNVGIGVTTLLNKLDVAGGVAIGSYAGVNTAPSNGLIVSGNVGIGTNAPAGTFHVANASSSVALVVATTGRVGIGTSAPATKLDVYTSATNESGFVVRDDGGARLFTVAELGSGGYNPMSSAGDIGLIYYGSGGSNTGSLMIGQWSSSARGIKIDASGNVGIGTATPVEKLEVAGNIKLSGATPTYKITNVASPTASSDVATKDYVDAAIGGNSIKLTKKIFVTSTSYSGNLGGRTGADSICQSVANSAGLGGTWKALIGTTDASIEKVLGHDWVTLENVDGTAVAQAGLCPKYYATTTTSVDSFINSFKSPPFCSMGHFADTNGKYYSTILLNPILSETGQPITSGYVWTGSSNQFGAKTTSLNYTCNNWTSSATTIDGLVGGVNTTVGGEYVLYTNFSANVFYDRTYKTYSGGNAYTAVYRCDLTARLYCVSN
ncbi:MAG: prepilin-type N-terminal cleavage/methylation domain-containing protein [Patescibacteria group bacterium]|nr:prepilin-type N-terminal cleavage/methylation domain-containing protein [Patescibacteria group bacterium]